MLYSSPTIIELDLLVAPQSQQHVEQHYRNMLLERLLSKQRCLTVSGRSGIPNAVVHCGALKLYQYLSSFHES
ncbi:MAG: hypothetical protein AABZ61_14465, partial [Bacteroidota bacterium]